MRVFLTGATGYIGSAVADALLLHGHEVSGLARSETAAAALRAKGVRPLRGDLFSPDAVAEAARQADATIHTAWSSDANAALADQAVVDRVLEALAESNKHFVYTSGVWVMGNTGQDADEESPTAPPSLLAWRVAVEQDVLGAADRGIRTAVIRPAIVYGRGAGIVAGLVTSARESGASVVVGDGENHWSFVHVTDLAELYVQVLGAPPATLLIAASGRPLQVREVARAASRAAGGGGRVQFWLVDEAFKEIGPLVEALVLDQRVTGRKAERLLGWKPTGPPVIEELERGSYAQRRAAS